MHEELLTAAATATIAPASLPPSPVVDATTAIPSAAVTVDSNPSKKKKNDDIGDDERRHRERERGINR